MGARPRSDDDRRRDARLSNLSAERDRLLHDLSLHKIALAHEVTRIGGGWRTPLALELARQCREAKLAWQAASTAVVAEMTARKQERAQCA